MTWTADKYFAKANKYWVKGTNLERGSEDFLLNVSFFCEFLLRGAVCHVNPALNASPDDESILFVAGILPEKPPKTAKTTTILNRVTKLIPAVTSKEADTIALLVGLRNQELHGDENSIALASQEVIMPQVFSFIVTIASFCGRDLAALLTPSDANQAMQTHHAIQKDRERRVKELVRIQKDRFFGEDEETQKAKRAEADPGFFSAVTKTGQLLLRRKCPSCSSFGILGGAPVGRSAPLLGADGIYQELRIVPNVYECKSCELKISGLDELISAGFGHEFISIDEVDVVEHFEIDPIDYVDVDEIVREYAEDMYDGYQDE